MTAPLHTITADLVRAELNLHHGLYTLVLTLRQQATRYTSEELTAVRSYPSTLAAARQARHDHLALQIGATYTVAAEALSALDGRLYLLGVCDVALAPAPARPYPLVQAALDQWAAEVSAA